MSVTRASAKQPPDPRLGIECFDCGAREHVMITEGVRTALGPRAWTLCRCCFATAERLRAEQRIGEEEARRRRAG
jgi:hypothetical protein